MRAHLVQLDSVWEDRQANFRQVEKLLDGAPVEAGDLVVLPEMFDSGFSMNTRVTADVENLTLEFLMRLADDLRAVVLGGRTVHPCHCTLAHNRATAAGPGGRVLADYSKVHPFTLGREPEHFEGGREVTTFAWGREGQEGLGVCPVVCYDLRFPELFRQGLLEGAECFAVIANWPQVRQMHWRSLLIARAIENQAFVLGINRTGRDPALQYAGGSIAVSPTGEVLGELGDAEGVLSVEIDPGVLRAWREKFPAWRDMRLLGRREGAGVVPKAPPSVIPR